MSETTSLRQGGAIINLTLEVGDSFLPCPFCGSVDIELANTHRASYWMECRDCGATVHGKAHGRDRASDKLTMRQHRMAKRSALAAWNRRFGPLAARAAAGQRHYVGADDETGGGSFDRS